MHIAHVTPKFVPEVGYQENYLPHEQQARGHDVTILTSAVPSPLVYAADQFDGPGVYEYGGVRTERLDTWVDVEDGGVVVLKGLERRLASLDPDVIHAHTLFNASTPRAVRFGRSHDVPVVVDAHVDNDNLHLDSLPKRLGVRGGKAVITRYVVPRASSLVAVNPHAEAFLRDALEVPPEKIEFLPLGVDTATFAPDPEQRAAGRARLGVDDGDLLVLTAGNLAPTKDVDVLLRAVASVRETADRLRLAVVGDGPDEYLSTLRTTADRLDIAHAVQFTGRVDHEALATLFNAADVGVWPGKLGISAVEATGTGLPLVVPASPATEYLVSNDNGQTFPRGDHEALADRLRRYVRDASLREAHAANAASFARETLAWDQIARQSVALYRRGA